MVLIPRVKLFFSTETSPLLWVSFVKSLYTVEHSGMGDPFCARWLGRVSAFLLLTYGGLFLSSRRQKENENFRS